jgi:hypothetical protein
LPCRGAPDSQASGPLLSKFPQSPSPTACQSGGGGRAVQLIGAGERVGGVQRSRRGAPRLSPRGVVWIYSTPAWYGTAGRITGCTQDSSSSSMLKEQGPEDHGRQQRRFRKKAGLSHTQCIKGKQAQLRPGALDNGVQVRGESLFAPGPWIWPRRWRSGTARTDRQDRGRGSSPGRKGAKHR